MHGMPNDGPFLLEIRPVPIEGASGAAYDVLYSHEGLSQIASFYSWLMDRLQLPTEGRLLDVSCGAGQLVRLAAQKGLQATGVDISYVAAKAALGNVGQSASLAVSDGESLPFPDASFDFVTCIGSLEHFLDPGRGVSEMARVIRPDGRAFILVPNTFSLLANVWIAFRTGRTSADRQPIQRYGARIDWTRLLEMNGLAVLRTLKYERARPRSWGDLQHYLRHRKELLHMLATPLIPLNLAWCFLFVCRPVDRLPPKMVDDILTRH